MSIAAKHAYRFGYLKSEQWQNVRVEVLARRKATCVLCGKVDLSNDVHHCVYPRNIWHTQPEHCTVLCRQCHESAHKTIKGRMSWAKFSRYSKALLKSRGMVKKSSGLIPRTEQMERKSRSQQLIMLLVRIKKKRNRLIKRFLNLIVPKNPKVEACSFCHVANENVGTRWVTRKYSILLCLPCWDKYCESGLDLDRTCFWRKLREYRRNNKTKKYRLTFSEMTSKLQMLSAGCACGEPGANPKSVG